jgi:hypothetical protein
VDNQQIIVRVAIPDDKKYSTIITDEMEASAAARGTGIAKRTPEYVEQKIDEGKAVIAVTREGDRSKKQFSTSPGKNIPMPRSSG